MIVRSSIERVGRDLTFIGRVLGGSDAVPPPAVVSGSVTPTLRRKLGARFVVLPVVIAGFPPAVVGFGDHPIERAGHDGGGHKESDNGDDSREVCHG
jgi:hypothetical protein